MNVYQGFVHDKLIIHQNLQIAYKCLTYLLYYFINPCWRFCQGIFFLTLCLICDHYYKLLPIAFIYPQPFVCRYYRETIQVQLG